MIDGALSNARYPHDGCSLIDEPKPRRSAVAQIDAPAGPSRRPVVVKANLNASEAVRDQKLAPLVRPHRGG